MARLLAIAMILGTAARFLVLASVVFLPECVGACAMGTTTFPSEGQRHGEDPNVLPAPCFSAQRWAVQVVRHAETEASRRGMRGSPAWEDAWRDALWTLAVQKRCVEDGKLGRDQTALEMRCVEMRQRVDLLEERLQLLSQQLEALLDSHAVAPTSAEATAVHVALPPGSGPLPAGGATVAKDPSESISTILHIIPGLSSPVRAAPRRSGPVPSPPTGAAPELSGLSFLSDDRDERIEDLQRQLQRAETERIDASRRLVSLEGELAMLQERAKNVETSLVKVTSVGVAWDRQGARAATYGFVAEHHKHIYGDRPESKRTPFCVRLLSPDLIASEDTKSWELEYSLREIRTATIRQAVEADLEGLRKSISSGKWDDLT
eukprot:s515_g9.t1